MPVVLQKVDEHFLALDHQCSERKLEKFRHAADLERLRSVVLVVEGFGWRRDEGSAAMVL